LGEASDDLSAPAMMPDGGFLVADGVFHDRVLRVGTDGRWRRVAGVDTYGFGGDGGPAREAKLSSPSAVAVTPDGGFLVSDTGNDRVRRVDPAGRIITVAGGGLAGSPLGDGGPATAARVPSPRALAVLSDGGFVVASAARVRRVGPDGVISTLAGTGRRGFAGDGGLATDASVTPRSLAIAADGSLLIAGSRRVRRVGADGRIMTVAGDGQRASAGDGGPAILASFREVSSVAALADGGFLIADPQAHRVRRVDALGMISTVVGPQAFADFADRTSYRAPWPGERLPLHLAVMSDGLLLTGSTGVLYSAGAAPQRPAIRLTTARAVRTRTMVEVQTSHSGTVTAELRRHGTKVASFSKAVPGGRATIRLKRRLLPAFYRIALTFTADTAIATDSVTLMLGGVLRTRDVVSGLDELYIDAHVDYAITARRCRRFSARRVDCEMAGGTRRRPCVEVRTVELGRTGVVRQRAYRCPRRGQPTFRKGAGQTGPSSLFP
jgi:hypothetical protein